MVGIAEISAAMASLQASKDILAALTGVRDAAKLNEVKIDLQGVLLDAQQGLFAAQQAQASADQRIAQLEQEVMRLKDWSEEAARYELVAPASGVFVYMQKPSMRTGEPPHWLCTSCFDAGKKSVLQRVADEHRPRERQWRCPACKSTVAAFYNVTPTYEGSQGG